MKILHVIHSANPIVGGPIEGIKQLAAARIPQAREIELLSLDAPGAPWMADFPLPLHAVGPGFLDYGYCSKIIPWLKANHQNYDVVVVNGIWQYNSLAVWHALRHTNTPYCVFTHGMLDPWFKKRYPLKHVKKWLYWPWAEYRVLRDADAVIFTCEEERLQARKSFWLYKCNERVITYGTGAPSGDPARQREIFLERFPRLRGKRLILFLGRIHEKKGGDLLVQAFHQLVAKMPEATRDFHLVMAGPGANAGFGLELKKVVDNSSIADRVSWPGMLSGDLKWGAFHSADAFILPSHQENFGISVAEALACSVPVLISDKVNIWREIDEDKAGFVENDDLAGTMKLLERWAGTSEAERLAMGKNAKECFLARFEISKAAESLREALDDIVSARARKPSQG